MPDLVSSYPNVRDLTISPDGSEYYFSVESHRKEFSAIVRVQQKDGEWQEPRVASFSGQYRDIEPAFSHDGKKLYFVSNRPISGSSGKIKDYDIWVVSRTEKDDEWSRPVNLGPPINTGKEEYYPSLTMKGDIYFTREAADPSRKEDIFVSRRNGSGYAVPEPLSDAVNSDRYEFNAYVAPDESFLVFTSYARPDDMGGGDLYISYSREGEWQAARHLGKQVNSNKIDYCPYVDLSNGILYFTSERSATTKQYEKPQSLESLLRDFNTGSFGAGRIYQIRFPLEPSDF
jgi:Tol biopolymer transport system component